MKQSKREWSRVVLPSIALLLLVAGAGCAAPDEQVSGGSSATGTLAWERAYVVVVFLETNTTADHTYHVSVWQNGTVVDSREARSMAGFPFRTFVMGPSVQAYEAVVRIRENSTELGSKTVRPQDCPSGEVAATIVATDSGATIKAACN